MRILITLFFISSILACTKKMTPNEDLPQYKFLTVASDDLATLKKQSKKSKIDLQFNFQTGSFKGIYQQAPFEGKFIIGHSSSGFSKGFFYRVSIESMVNQVARTSEEDDFYEKIKKTTQIYIFPDKLLTPNYTQIEFRAGEPAEKLIFVHLAGTKDE